MLSHLFQKGQQGQVERLNGTVKLATSKSILGRIYEGVLQNETFESLQHHEEHWVDRMMHMLDVYNNTPKEHSKRLQLTPLETHNPELIGKANQFFAENERDLQVFELMNEREVYFCACKL
jgi:hypothetical protein